MPERARALLAVRSDRNIQQTESTQFNTGMKNVLLGECISYYAIIAENYTTVH